MKYGKKVIITYNDYSSETYAFESDLGVAGVASIIAESIDNGKSILIPTKDTVIIIKSQDVLRVAVVKE